MKYMVAFLCVILFVSSALAQSVEHTVNWEKGVNKRVVKEWVVSLNKISNTGSTTYIRKKSGGEDKLHIVGHRDVIIWVPDTANLTRDFTIVLWFHGHYGYVPRRTFEDRVLKQFMPYVKSKNFVVVIPELPWSVHTKTPAKRNSLVWQKPSSFLYFVAQVHEVLAEHFVAKGSDYAKTPPQNNVKIDYKIVGHSAGGSVIKRLGITGDLCRLGPSMVVWSDSSYGRWLDNAWDGCLKETDIPIKVLVVRNGPPHTNARRFFRRFKKKPKNVVLHVKGKGWTHKLVGNNSVDISNLMNLQKKD